MKLYVYAYFWLLKSDLIGLNHYCCAAFARFIYLTEVYHLGLCNPESTFCHVAYIPFSLIFKAV